MITTHGIDTTTIETTRSSAALAARDIITCRDAIIVGSARHAASMGRRANAQGRAKIIRAALAVYDTTRTRLPETELGKLAARGDYMALHAIIYGCGCDALAACDRYKKIGIDIAAIAAAA